MLYLINSIQSPNRRWTENPAIAEKHGQLLRLWIESMKSSCVLFRPWNTPSLPQIARGGKGKERIIFCASQNPVPALGKGESNPPQSQTATNQTHAYPGQPPSEETMFLPESFYRSYGGGPPGNYAGQGNDKSSADWWMVGITGLLALIAIGQCVVTIRQWRVMNDTVQAAKDSTERGLRAYIGTINNSADQKFNSANGLPEYYNVYVENGGQTPAYKMSCHSTWDYFVGEMAQWPQGIPFKGKNEIELEDPQKGSLNTVGSRHRMTYRCILKPHRDGTTFQAAMVRAQKKEVTIFIYGVVHYEDAFGKVVS